MMNVNTTRLYTLMRSYLWWTLTPLDCTHWCAHTYDERCHHHHRICAGHARCTKLRLDAVLKVIDQCAFVTSPYPVIISLENHCTGRGHKAIASLLRRCEDFEYFLSFPGSFVCSARLAVCFNHVLGLVQTVVVVIYVLIFCLCAAVSSL